MWNVTIGRDVAEPFRESTSEQSVLDVRNLLLLGTDLPAEALNAVSNLAVDAVSFVDVAADDYHLVAGSPAVDSGEALAEVAVDRDRLARPQSGVWDVGAYEYE